ncbi:ATP-binding cassette domain-containing protein [Tuanshanicoccus lijuaniae]|uniref:ABC transporter ATP-binding protein n=1 Tax=Aerococcaceae bacterium zg-1292 TaxID=2774330 RepID=UPI001937C9FA|nr:ATP-binding cassette domain-containing protein [Aerococcaceae bacterium zg-1292]MBF6625487.1 ATP-binding cassette domain-containing protein [Aerococcaceae bacterium zg-BR9]MBF6977674.1 ATP-binding cassette domain-containing protein [Aerococcaceae bacterium zg-BR22]MBS4456894.1 ATP-binding cassette domain-containing protein [Aerococcaceae bacterium zg-A91]MBS4458724.1 ATP-binding cassette domain-containing protein [Aerococcaceae bacterium zg-BR33]
MIEVKNINYTYQTFEKSAGFLGSVKDFMKREYQAVVALDDLNFTINEGEFVGLLGANGAGKTTLIKLMTGILSPTSGDMVCNGFNPYLRQPQYLKNIGVVLGQKSQLIWDLPAKETLEMLKVVYDIEQTTYDKRVNELCELLNVSHKLQVPVRKLSLGERIKFEIICALIHSPKLLFLDEPTIGLDITSQKSIRQFLTAINQQENVTVILTSHYMQDIEEMCQRVIVLSKGRVLDDLSIEAIKQKYTVKRDIILTFKTEVPHFLQSYQLEGSVVSIPEEDYPQVASQINVMDIQSIGQEESSLEDIIFRLFSENR